MTVRELAELYIDGSESMEIWDYESEKTVFRGTYDEATESECADEEVANFEIEGETIVINI